MDQKFRNGIENYKKQQIYTFSTSSIEDDIIYQLQIYLQEFSEKIPSQNEKELLLTIIIAYLEFGFEYMKYVELFSQIQDIIRMNRNTIFSMVNWNAQYIKSSKKDLQKVLIWKNENKKPKKGAMVDEIYSLIKNQKKGKYLFESGKNQYILTVCSEGAELVNQKKGIKYHIIT